MREPLLQRHQFLGLLVAAALSASLLIACLLWSARQDALHAAQVTALNYARTLNVRLETSFRRADSILQTLVQATPVQALAPGGQAQFGQRLNGELDAMHSEFDEMIALRIIDRHGDQRYVSSASSTPAANYADRSFFSAYRSGGARGLLFSEVVMGRVSGQPTIVMTRPLIDANGQFYGAVLAPLDLSFFQTQFKKLDVGASGAIFLRRTDDGRLVLRSPRIDAEVNARMPAGHPIMRAVLAGQTESVDEYVAFTDGVKRISGTVAIQSFPFFLTVALSESDVLASWRRLAWLTGATWTVLMAALAALMWRLWRSDSERRSLTAQLRESQRIESIGTLAGGIAHDFNNILAVILGHAALAGDQLGPLHPAQASLGQIRKASTRARDLVQQILAFGRRQSQQLVNQPLQPLVQEAAEMLRCTLPASVRLDCKLPDVPLHVVADATQVQQVLMNLCTNAWHALSGEPGQIQIALQPFVVDGDPPMAVGGLAMGQYARLSVRDSGCGMDESTRARIFEPFFTTKPTGQGTGLGMSVVHGIVATHRGQIQVASELGRGTTVDVYFPVADERPAQAPQATANAPAPTQGGQGQRLVYIDDDEVVALLVEQLLHQDNYAVTTFAEGQTAIAAVEEAPHRYDLVITDFNMPGCSGIEVARRLRAIRPGLPVIISSGYITDELRQQAGEAGVRSVMQKQNTLEELTQLVRTTLQA